MGLRMHICPAGQVTPLQTTLSAAGAPCCWMGKEVIRFQCLWVHGSLVGYTVEALYVCHPRASSQTTLPPGRTAMFKHTRRSVVVSAFSAAGVGATTGRAASWGAASCRIETVDRGWIGIERVWIVRIGKSSGRG